MPLTSISSTATSDLTTNQENYSVATQILDNAAEQKETFWYNTTWSKYLGYYKKIPNLKIAIDTRAKWVMGRGFEADEMTTMILDRIKGWGKDTFNSILKNLLRTKYISGNAYAEIITDEDDMLINLKPLDPGTMVHVVNQEGKLIRFEQQSKVKGKKNITFKPEDIFYLSQDRLADEIHGISIIEALEENILARNEAISDWKRVLHRNVNPVRIWHLDTDDSTEINNFITKTETALKDAENIYIPKGTVEHEVGSVAPNATLNPSPWIEQLNQDFFQSNGMPEIVVGTGKSLTEANGKVGYLAWQQTVEEEQLEIEEQVLAQLNVEVKLNFPASLDRDAFSGRDQAVSDQAYDMTMNPPNIQTGETAIEPNDQMVEWEGRK